MSSGCDSVYVDDFSWISEGYCSFITGENLSSNKARCNCKKCGS